MGIVRRVQKESEYKGINTSKQGRKIKGKDTFSKYTYTNDNSAYRKRGYIYIEMSDDKICKYSVVKNALIFLLVVERERERETERVYIYIYIYTLQKNNRHAC